MSKLRTVCWLSTSLSLLGACSSDSDPDRGISGAGGEDSSATGGAANGASGASNGGSGQPPPVPEECIGAGEEQPEPLESADIQLQLDFSQQTLPLEHIWRATGMTPARLLHNGDMQQQMKFMDAVAHNGMEYVRPHWLLERIRLSSETSTDYGWERLDFVLDELVNNGQKLIFELMGHPEGETEGAVFDFTNAAHVTAWKNLVTALANRLIERYGREEVRSWYFETWNEPNLDWFWKQSIEAFLNYYDACSQGLAAADPELRFGGPGASEPLPEVFKALMKHVDDTGARMDFVSMHSKALPSDMVAEQLQVHEYLKANHPELAKLPHINDEADPVGGWSKDTWWHAHPWYAAFVAQSAQYQFERLIDGHGLVIPLQSNDHAFMGSFGQRTMFARFGEFYRFSLVKKPVYTVLNVMAHLGNERLPAVEIPAPHSDHVGVWATKRGHDQVAVLLYHRPDIGADLINAGYPDVKNSGQPVSVALDLRGLPVTVGAIAERRIDPQHGNPFSKWVDMGLPQEPSAQQLQQMRDIQDPVWISEPETYTRCGGQKSLRVELPPSSVSLILLSRQGDPPAQVAEVNAELGTGVTHHDEVLVSWNGLDNRTLRTYEVLYKAPGASEAQRVNVTDFLDAAFLHIPEQTGGTYQVRAVDFWGRAGEPSAPVSTQ